MNEEAWKAVPGYEGLYEVSDHGRVRSAALDGRTLKLRVDTSDRNRPYVQLSRNGVTVEQQVGRVVLLAFVGPCPDGMECCHNDGDPLYNHPRNLRWDTREANALDQLRHGTHYQAAKTHCPHGHPYTPENTRLHRTRGGRICRTCDSAAKVKARIAAKAASQGDPMSIDTHFLPDLTAAYTEAQK